MKTTPKKNGGFTLVELIVVIAILAILAAVAIPAYSGYIAKAEEANDLQLLGAVSTAFNSACVENGIYDMSDMVGTVIELEEGYIVGMDVKQSLSNTPDTTGNPVFASFIRYYGDNINTPFKVFIQIVYTEEGFVGYGEDDCTVATLPGGGTITLTPAQVTLLQNSTYASDIGGLMGQVDNVSGLVYNLLDGTGQTTEIIKSFTGSDEYKLNMIAALGGTYDPNSGKTVAEQYTAAFGAYTEKKALEKVAAQLGISVDEVDTTGGNIDHFLAYSDALTAVTDQANKNMLIMGVAQNAAKQDAAGAMTIINSTNPKSDLIQAMTQTDDGMGQAALVYGAFTAYAMAEGSGASDAAKAAIKNSSDPTAVFDCMTGDELLNFQKYMATQQGKDDLDACIEAMGVINTTSKDQEAVAGLMTECFNNTEFVDALNGLLGNG